MSFNRECPFCGENGFKNHSGLLNHVRAYHFLQIKQLKHKFRRILENKEKYDEKEVFKASLAAYFYTSHNSKKYRPLARRIIYGRV